MSQRHSMILLISLAAGPIGAAAPPQTPPKNLVVFAPGYPGNTATAQPTMDAFARLAAGAAGWGADTLRALYFETAEGGLKRLAEPDAVLALVSLPLFLQQEAALSLSPRLQAVPESGALETWSLAVRRGRVASPAALDGWEITGTAGYAPGFVRGPVLAGWGAPPATARVTYTANVLAALRRAAAGETVAVVLDRSQAKAMESLPFASDLEVVARSEPLPGTLLCSVGSRLPPKQGNALVHGFSILHTRPDSEDLLKTMRLTRFEAVDRGALEAARRSYVAVRAAATNAR